MIDLYMCPTCALYDMREESEDSVKYTTVSKVCSVNTYVADCQ